MFVLPNLFTLSSIFCGFYGAVVAAGATAGDPADLYRACIAVLFAMVFDSVDGRVARLTRTQSEFGVQMDSLADVVSFGAAPALIAWHWGLSTFGTLGLLTCFAYCACGAIRLARFNVMAAQAQGPGTYFVGLPIPAAAGLLVATIISFLRGERQSLTDADIWAPAMMVGLGLLMVSTIRFRTFKATRMTWRTFALIMLVFACTLVVAVQVRTSFAIVTLMASYLALGLAEEAARRLRRLLVPAGEPGAAPEEEDEEEEEDLLEDTAFYEDVPATGPILDEDDEEDLLD